MRLEPRSILHRLLLGFLFVGVVTGGPLIFVSFQVSKETAIRLSEQSALQQMAGIAEGFQQEFSVNVRRALRAASASEPLAGYVAGNADERVIQRKTLETYLQRLAADYESLSGAYYLQADGHVVVSVADGRRGVIDGLTLWPAPAGQDEGSAASPAQGGATTRHLARLFQELRTTPLLLSSGNMEWFMPPREVSVVGPFADEQGRLSFLAGLAILDLENGAFGGAVLVRVRLDRFAAKLGTIPFISAHPVWLLGADGTAHVAPPDGEARLDPRGRVPDAFAAAPVTALSDDGFLAVQDLPVIAGKPFLRMAYAIPAELLIEDFDPTMRLFLLVLAASGALALGLAFWLSRNLSTPIIRLADAASRLARGDLGARAEVRSSGELQVLVESFNQMSANLQLADRKRSTTLDVLRRTAAYLLQAEGAGGSAGRPPEEVRRLLDEIAGDSAEGPVAEGDGEPDDLRVLTTLIVRLFREREDYLETIRAARDAAEEANRAKGDFLATMSHEIRTPLNAVIGLSEVLHRTSLTDEQRQLVSTMETAGRQLLQIINDVLDFSRLQAGRIELVEGPVAMRPLIESLMLIIRGLPGAANLAVSADLPADMPGTIVVDGQRLMQILLNLLGNAVKFTAEGSVRLDIRRLAAATPGGGERLRLAVTDTGPGVAAEMRERIFEPFKQAGSDRFTPHAGSGLGLSICRMLASAMGGRVALEETGPGGSRFALEIPLREASVAEASTVPEPAPANERPGLNILVAEDMPANQLVIRLLLQRMGHTVRVVSNGRQAVDAFPEEPYDAILLDVQMPVMNGYEAARAIRASGPRGARVPIVALTAFTQPSDREEALANGVDAFLPKPVRSADVARTLEELCHEAPPAALPASPAARD